MTQIPSRKSMSSESELDKEASLRGNSTYLVDRVIPMLPEVLSNGLCSLVPGEDRLTHAAIMDFDSKGSMISVRFCKAIINNSSRFTYEQAYSLLNEPDPQNPFSERLSIAWELAEKLRKRRIKSGALELDMPEIKVILDKKGKPVKSSQSAQSRSDDVTDRMILMMLNEAVACLQEGVVTSEELLDAGMIFGTGFAPFRGGPLQYACDRGVKGIVETLNTFAKQYGERFAPSDGWGLLLDDEGQTVPESNDEPVTQEQEESLTNV